MGELLGSDGLGDSREAEKESELYSVPNYCSIRRAVRSVQYWTINVSPPVQSQSFVSEFVAPGA